MCSPSLKQTSVIKDPVTFFLSHTTREDDLFLTDITLSDSIIMESIKELSPNSEGGPDGIPASLLINCAEGIAPALKIIFSHSLSSSLIPNSFKKQLLFLFSSQVINPYLVIIVQYL